MARIRTAYGLPPSKSGPWLVGPYTVEMTPTAAVKRVGRFSETLSLGLLVQLPDPDGVGSSELEHPAYMRQLVELAPRSASHLAIPRHVRFHIPGCPPVIGLGLYDTHNTLEGYGVFRSSRVTSCRPERFDFPSHQIQIKRPPSSR